MFNSATSYELPHCISYLTLKGLSEEDSGGVFDGVCDLGLATLVEACDPAVAIQSVVARCSLAGRSCGWKRHQEVCDSSADVILG